MSDRSKIEWTDATWTPIRARRKHVNVGDPGWRTALPGGSSGWYCEHVSEGCRNCYAEGINKRLGTGLEFKPGHLDDVDIFLDEKMLLVPLHWKRPRMVFVCSMTDLFGNWVKDDWIDKIFAVMALCPQHTFQVLTKRAERMRDWFNTSGQSDERVVDVIAQAFHIGGTEKPNGEIIASDSEVIEIRDRWPLPNVWLGISAERQEEADERIPHLLQTPAAVRFVSLEPLLGPISFRWAKWQPWNKQPGSVSDHLDGARQLDWVIVGGESGPGARPMNPQWARDLRNQCEEARVPYFFKQWGEWVTDDGYPGEKHRIGKRAAGRLLDGREHNDMPRPIASTSHTQRG